MAMKPNTSLSKDSEDIIETTGDIEDLAHITPVPVHENIISEIQDTQQPSDSLVTDIEIVQDSNPFSPLQDMDSDDESSTSNQTETDNC